MLKVGKTLTERAQRELRERELRENSERELRESKQRSRKALGVHSVRAMPWRGLLFLEVLLPKT